MASVIKDTCTNCGICEPLCPTKSIFPGLAKFSIDYDTCDDCQICVSSCPVQCIVPARKQPEKKAKKKD